MSSLTSKQIKQYMLEFETSPGFVLKLTRRQFEDLVDSVIDLEYDLAEMQESNTKRLKHLLQTCTDEQAYALVAALRASH